MNRSELVVGQTYHDRHYARTVTLAAVFEPDDQGDDVVVRTSGNHCFCSKSSRLSLPPITRGVYRANSGSLMYVFCPVQGDPDRYHTFTEYYLPTGSGSRPRIETGQQIRGVWPERVGDLPEYPLGREPA